MQDTSVLPLLSPVQQKAANAPLAAPIRASVPLVSAGGRHSAGQERRSSALRGSALSSAGAAAVRRRRSRRAAAGKARKRITDPVRCETGASSSTGDALIRAAEHAARRDLDHDADALASAERTTTRSPTRRRHFANE
jgi:hypothetical protein